MTLKLAVGRSWPSVP